MHYFLEGIVATRRKTYEAFVDALFFACLLLYPFSHAFINRDTGGGAFLKYIYLLFIVFAVPIWKRYWGKWNPAYGLFAIYIGLGFLMDFITFPEMPFSVKILLIRQSVIVFIFGVSAYNLILKDPKCIKFIIWIILCNAVVSAAVLFAGIGVTENFEKGVEGYRYAVMGQNSNESAHGFVYYIEFCVFMLAGTINVRKRHWLVALLCLPIVIIALLKVSSRGAIATLLLTAPLFLFVGRNISKKMIYFVLICIGGVAIIMAVLMSDNLRARLENTLYERDTGGREAIFYISAEVWLEHPFFGSGLIHHPYLISDKLGMGYALRTPNRATHNTYLEALAGAGVVGFAFFMAFLFAVGKCAWRNRQVPYGNYLFIIFCSLLVFGLVGNVTSQNTSHLIVALVLGFDYWMNRVPYLKLV